jgi:Cu-processing system ATP-binding protein
VIQISRLVKRFGDLVALNELSLEVTRGRITAVVGPNAAGKTTLIKTIVGLTRPDSGSVVVNGTLVNGDERYRAAIGYMPQIAHFPGNMCAWELLELLRELRANANLPVMLDKELVDGLALRAYMDKPLRTLSGGSRQKVNVALAFLFSPSLLVLDEPTAGLDPLSSSILKDKILALRSEQRTVLITSHVMNELEELADDVALLIEGEVAFSGTLAELKERTRQSTLERAVASLMAVRQVAA